MNSLNHESFTKSDTDVNIASFETMFQDLQPWRPRLIEVVVEILSHEIDYKFTCNYIIGIETFRCVQLQNK